MNEIHGFYKNWSKEEIMCRFMFIPSVFWNFGNRMLGISIWCSNESYRVFLVFERRTKWLDSNMYWRRYDENTKPFQIRSDTEFTKIWCNFHITNGLLNEFIWKNIVKISCWDLWLFYENYSVWKHDPSFCFMSKIELHLSLW